MKTIGFKPLDPHREARFFHTELATLGSPKRAQGEKNYHKSTLKHHGVDQPTKKRLVNEWFQRHPEASTTDILHIADRLWTTNWFEEKSISILMLRKIGDQLQASDFHQIEQMLAECEGWAHTDELAIHVLGPFAHRYPGLKPTVAAWASEAHLWKARSSLIFQINEFRTNSADLKLHKDSIEAALENPYFTTKSDIFFLHKAIGWSLREIGGHNQLFVEQFLADHKPAITPVIYKEAIKKLDPDSALITNWKL